VNNFENAVSSMLEHVPPYNWKQIKLQKFILIKLHTFYYYGKQW